MKNQTLKTLDLGLLLVLMLGSLMVFLLLMSSNRQDPSRAKALLDAKNLTLQLASGGLGALKNEAVNIERDPASFENNSDFKRSLELFGHQGKISKDPWGNAFRYNFIETEHMDHRVVHVIVWSDGPNAIKETNVEDLKEIKGFKTKNLK